MLNTLNHNLILYTNEDYKCTKCGVIIYFWNKNKSSEKIIFEVRYRDGLNRAVLTCEETIIKNIIE